MPYTESSASPGFSLMVSHPSTDQASSSLECDITVQVVWLQAIHRYATPFLSAVKNLALFKEDLHFNGLCSSNLNINKLQIPRSGQKCFYIASVSSLVEHSICYC